MKKIIAILLFIQATAYAQSIVADRNGKYGVYFQESDSLVIPHQYISIDLRKNFYFCAKSVVKSKKPEVVKEVDIYNSQHQKIGSLNQVDFSILNDYSWEDKICETTLIFKEGEKYGLALITENSISKSVLFDQVYLISNPWNDESSCYKLNFIFKKNDAFGILQPNGKILIEPISADNVLYIDEIDAYQFVNGGVSSIYSNEGKLLVNDVVSVSGEIWDNDRCAVVTTSNNKQSIILNNHYHEINADEIISCLTSGRIIVNHAGKFSIMNLKLELVSDKLFEDVIPYQFDGYTSAKLNGKWIFIDSAANQVGKLTFDQVEKHPDSHFFYLCTNSATGNEAVYITTSPYFELASDNPVSEFAIGSHGRIGFGKQNEMWGYIGYGKNKFVFEYKNITNEIPFFEDESILLAETSTGHFVIIDDNGMVHFNNLNLTKIVGLKNDYEEYFLQVYQGNKVALTTHYTNDEWTPEFIYEEFIFDNDLFDYTSGLLVRKDGMMGLAMFDDAAMIELIPPKYDELIFADYRLLEMGFIVTRNDDQYGIYPLSSYFSYYNYDTSLLKVIEPIYDEVYSIEDDMIILKKDKLYGIYSYDNVLLSFTTPIFIDPPYYDFLNSEYKFTEIKVNCVKKWVIGFSDTLIYIDNYWRADKNSDAYIITRGNKYGVIDLYYGTHVPIIYDQVIPLNEELCLVRSGNEWGFFTTNLHPIVPIKNILSNELNFSLALDTTDKKTLDPQIDNAFYTGDVTVIQKGKFYGAINWNYEGAPIYLPAVFMEDPSDFISGEVSLGEIQINGIDKFIFKTDSSFIVIDERIQPDKKIETYIIKVGEKFGAVDNQYGGYFLPIYDEVIPLFDERFIVRIGNKWGMLGSTGIEMIPLEFNSMEEVLEFSAR